MRQALSLLCLVAIFAVALAQLKVVPKLHEEHKDSSFRFKWARGGYGGYRARPVSIGGLTWRGHYYGEEGGEWWWNNWDYGIEGCCCLDDTCEKENIFVSREVFYLTQCKEDCRVERVKYSNCSEYYDEVCADYAKKTVYTHSTDEHVEYDDDYDRNPAGGHVYHPKIIKSVTYEHRRTFIPSPKGYKRPTNPTTQAFVDGAGASDIRLKNNIVQISSAYPQLGINCYSWQWNQVATQRYNLTGNAQGVIAQEVMHLFPQAVKKGDDGYYRVDYGYLHAKENNSPF